MTTGAASIFEERIDPGRVSSAVLAAAVHMVLMLVLIFVVRWQNRSPEPVVVELWSEPPSVPIQAEPKPVPKVEPALPPRPEPVIPKPEIAEKTPPPRPVPRLEPKPKPEPPKAAAKPRDQEAQRQIRDQLLREQSAFAIDREREHIRDQLASDAAAARNRGLADWVNKVRTKIRGNVVLPPDIKGNPEAIFDVVQLPTGEVLSARLRKTSGHRALDDAIERAILKSSPLPRPDRSESAPREFELKYRPLD